MSVREVVDFEANLSGNLSPRAKDAAQNVRRLGDSAREAERSLDGLQRGGEKLAAMVGGPVGDLADIVFDVGGAASGATAAIGAVGTAVLGTGVAVGALALASKGMADAAVEASARLTEQGLAALIPPEAAAGIRDYQAASADLRIQVDLLTVTFGSGFASALADVSRALIGSVAALREMGAAVAPVTGALSSFGDAISWLSPVRIELELAAAAYGALVDKGAAVTESTKKQATAAQDFTASIVDFFAASSAGTAKVLADEPKKQQAYKATANVRIAEEKRTAEYVANIGDDIIREANEAARDAQTELQDALRATAEAAQEASDAMGEVGRQSLAAMSGPDSFRSFGGPNATGAASSAMGDLEQILPAAFEQGATRAFGALGTTLLPLVGIPDLISQSLNIYRSLDAAARSFPDRVSSMIRDDLPELITLASELPKIVTIAIGQLPGAIITALPELFPSLAKALGEAIWTVFGGITVDLFQSLLDGLFDGLGTTIKEAITTAMSDLLAKVAAPFTDRQGDVLGTDLRGADKRVLGVRLPGFALGTPFVERDGPAFLHRGERVVTASENASRGRGGSSMSGPVTINVHGVQDARALLREIRELLGTYGGLGESLDAYA